MSPPAGWQSTESAAGLQLLRGPKASSRDTCGTSSPESMCHRRPGSETPAEECLPPGPAFIPDAPNSLPAALAGWTRPSLLPHTCPPGLQAFQSRITQVAACLTPEPLTRQHRVPSELLCTRRSHPAQGLLAALRWTQGAGKQRANQQCHGNQGHQLEQAIIT